MRPQDFIWQLTRYAIEHIPCLFIIDFERAAPLLFTDSELRQQGILHNLNAHFAQNPPHPASRPITLTAKPLAPELFHRGFTQVKQHIQQGDSYLLNLCYRTEISLNCSLRTLFHQAQAAYKLYVPESFVVFSPEPFVKIRANRIHTFPMKGTISNSIPDAENILLNNPKEIQEHNTIVDLMRNDLAQIAQNVRVKSYRYVERIATHKGGVLQTSSEIVGDLPPNWRSNLGQLIYQLLPAGSVSGAPKVKTLEIIRQVEAQPRGYYTGVFGYYDGQNLDSAVAIRFIEQRGQKFYFCAGSGITCQSEEQAEYQEILHKIYVPTV